MDVLSANKNTTVDSSRLWFLLPMAVAALFACVPVDSPDTWWHLASGRWIVENGRIPKIDPLLYTSGNQRWIDYSWGAQLLFYGAHQLLGVSGVVLVKVLAAAGAAFLFWLLALKRGCNSLVSALCCSALLAVASACFRTRPLMLSAVWAPWVLLGLFSGSGRGLLFACIGQLFWANTHASFPVGVVAAVLVAVEAGISHRFPSLIGELAGRDELRWKCAAIPVLALVSLINPNGSDVFFMAGHLIALGWDREFIEEMSPISFAKAFEIRFAVVAAVAWVAAIWSVFKNRKLPVALLALMAMFTWQAFDARRFIFYWAFLAMPPVALAFNGLIMSGRAQVRKLVCLLLAAAAFATVAHAYRAVSFSTQIGLGISERALPVAAVEFMKKNGITGNIVCEHSAGGYIAWALPGARPSSDSRYADNNIEMTHKIFAMTHGQHNWRDAIPEKGVSDVMVFNVHVPSPIHEIIDSWAVVYWDNSWMIMLRRGGEYQAVIDRCEVTPTAPAVILHVYSLLTKAQKKMVEKSIDEKIAADEKCGAAYFAKGYILSRKAVALLTLSADKLDEALVLEKSGAADRAEKIKWEVGKARDRVFELLVEASVNFKIDISLNPAAVNSMLGMAGNAIFLGNIELAEKIYMGMAMRRAAMLVRSLMDISSIGKVLARVYGLDSQRYRDMQALERRIRIAARRNLPAIERHFQLQQAKPPAWLYGKD